MLLLQSMEALVADDYISQSVYDGMSAILFLPIMQTLSVVEYNTTISSDPAKAGSNTNPWLYRTANMYVWAFGMGSRTSYLGVVVAIAGVLVVLVQFVLGLVDRRRYRSVTQLLVAALEHSPQGEFDGQEHNEKEMARVRFHIQDATDNAGKFHYHSQRK